MNEFTLLGKRTTDHVTEAILNRIENETLAQLDVDSKRQLTEEGVNRYNKALLAKYESTIEQLVQALNR